MIARPVLDDIRVRAVQGRVIDPFRGTPDESPNRLASRETDTQPFADVLAAIEGMALVKVARQGRRLALERGDERLDVKFVSGARRVSLDDLVLDGDGRLAIGVMVALLPLFGPTELTIGRYQELIDGHEPTAAIVERFDTWFVEDSLRVAKKLELRDAKEAEAKAFAGAEASRRVYARQRRHGWMLLGAMIVIVSLLAFSGPIYRALTEKDIGETCESHGDCTSGQCLPRQPVSIRPDEIYARSNAPAPGPGVCTHACASDLDCPSSMFCSSELVSLGIVMAKRTTGCVPRAWLP